MKRQTINREASDKIIISSFDSMSHSTCCSKVTWPQRCTVARPDLWILIRVSDHPNAQYTSSDSLDIHSMLYHGPGPGSKEGVTKLVSEGGIAGTEFHIFNGILDFECARECRFSNNQLQVG